MWEAYDEDLYATGEEAEADVDRAMTFDPLEFDEFDEDDEDDGYYPSEEAQ